MQSLNADRLALPLLGTLLQLPLEPKQQRELLFWAADSYSAKQQTARAAADYLRSTTLLDGFGFDPRGQAARYNAAEVLVESGAMRVAVHSLKCLRLKNQLKYEPSAPLRLRVKQ